MKGRIVALLAGVLASASANAGEPWIAPGDPLARHDIQMLVDEGVIDLPVSGWPIAVSDLANALSKIHTDAYATGADAGAVAGNRSYPGGQSAATASRSPALNAAQMAAVTRLRRFASEGHMAFGVRVSGDARPDELRTFDWEPREEGELAGWVAGFVGSRWGTRLEITGVVDPDDGDDFRLDGSYFAGKFGNWIVSVGAQDRWWGSGWDGSLILSTNARPVPAIALDRAISDPFETKWLRWIGPWRLTTFMGYMDGDRHDYDHPLLFGMRISARPLDGLEISVERTAQWCGEGRSCRWKDFWNLFTGHDNAGENVNPADEPGNQLAGWDIRWASPIGHWNYALYNQHTGETIDNKIPRPYRSLDLAGIETWGHSADEGTSWRLGFEWANTRCGGTENGEKLWDCAYNNNIFDVEGYRYKGRPLGDSIDGDGDTYGLRYMRADGAGRLLTILGRYSRINEGGVVPDTRHSIAPGPEDWWSLDATLRVPVRGGRIDASAGVEYRDRQWNDTSAVLPRVWVSWQHDFQ